MAKFTDSKGEERTISFDAFVLDEVEQATGIDLADLSGNGYATIGQNSTALVKVLAALCGESFKAFAPSITGQTIVDGRQAVLEAAADFFPPSEWSEIQSSLEKSKGLKKAIADGKELAELGEVLETIRPILATIEAMPPEMKAGAKAEMLKAIEEAGGTASDLEQLEALASAGGQAVTPSNAAIDLPASAESQPAA